MRLRAQQERKTCGQKKAAAFVELRPNHTHNAKHARHQDSLGACAVIGKFLRVELTIFDVAAHFRGMRLSIPAFILALATYGAGSMRSGRKTFCALLHFG
jgi:hypothetical protein